jgi:hypothetical protein
MSSTRNINTTGNYCIEQEKYKNASNYALYPYSQYGVAYDTKAPGNGFLPGQVPANQLSNNSVDIESFLMGINLTNLVNPAQNLSPDLKCLETVDIYKNPVVYMPIPLTVSTKNRPQIN